MEADVQGGQTAESPAETTFGFGLSNVQIQTVFSLQNFFSNVPAEESNIVPAEECDTEPQEIEIICDEQVSPQKPTPMSSEASNFYLDADNLYVCRSCQKTFKLKLIAKMHHCANTHCGRCEQQTDSCRCACDSPSNGMDTDISLDGESRSGTPSYDDSVHFVNSEQVPHDTSDNLLQSGNTRTIVNIRCEEVMSECSQSGDTNSPRLPTIVSTVSLAQTQHPSASPPTSNPDNVSNVDYLTDFEVALKSVKIPVNDEDDARSSSSEAGPDSDSEQQLLSCTDCPSTFFEQDQLKAHCTKEHPGGNGSIKVISIINVPSQTLRLPEHDIEDHLNYNIVKRVNESQIQNITVQRDPAVTLTSAPQPEHVPCRTCGVMFSTSDAYYKHTGSCFRVFSSTLSHGPQPVLPLQSKSTQTRGKRIAGRRKTFAHNDYVNILCKPKMIEQRKNSTSIDFDNLCNKEKPRLAFSKQITSSASSLLNSKSEVNGSNEPLEKILPPLLEPKPNDSFLETSASSEVVSFPQPIVVVKLEAEEPDAAPAHCGLTVQVKVEVDDGAPLPPSPAARAPSRGQLYQLTLEPRVKLTRCDASVSSAGAYSAVSPARAVRCAVCGLSFSCALRLSAHARAHRWPCALCGSEWATRAQRTLHAQQHRALLQHYVGAPPGPAVSLSLVGRSPAAVLPCLARAAPAAAPAAALRPHT